MVNNHNSAATLAQEFVKGERPWAALRDIGISIDLTSDEPSVSGSISDPYHVKAVDIAYAIVKHSSNTEFLQQWATVVLAGTGFLDLSDLEAESKGDFLLECLWDLQLDGCVDVKMLESAKQVLSH